MSSIILRMSATGTINSSNLRVSCVSDMGGWCQLEAEWQELVGNSAANGVFLSWPWLDSWMEVYGEGEQWMVLTARDADGRLLGVAPMMLDHGTGPVGRWIRRIILVGQKADTASEYLDWILLQGHEQATVAAFCDFLFLNVGRSWDLLYFGTMRVDSITIPLLQQEFASRRQCIHVIPTSKAPFLRLPDTWQGFLDSRRAKFRQRINKFHRDHSTAIRLAGRDMSVAEGMAKIRELNEHRWGVQRRSFLSQRYVRFHDRVAERLHACGHLLLIFLEVDGIIIAGRYDFVYGGKGWSFQGGWLPEWEKESAGKLMLTEIMRWCIDNGIREYDFLVGKASYKSDWSEEERQIVDLQATNPGSWRGKLYNIIKKVAQITKLPAN